MLTFEVISVSLYFSFLFGSLSYPLLVSAFQLGIKAWKNVRDCIGFTPEDYALAQGHDSYIRLVQKKIDKQHHQSQVVLNIPGVVSYEHGSEKRYKWVKVGARNLFCMIVLQKQKLT